MSGACGEHLRTGERGRPVRLSLGDSSPCPSGRQRLKHTHQRGSRKPAHLSAQSVHLGKACPKAISSLPPSWVMGTATFSSVSVSSQAPARLVSLESRASAQGLTE